MTNTHELISGDDTLLLTVHYQEGRCDDPGAFDRPKHYEPSEVTYVEDELGNDLTEWAIKHIGHNDLIDKRSTQLVKFTAGVLFPVYAVGENDAREKAQAFFDCLPEHTTLNSIVKS